MAMPALTASGRRAPRIEARPMRCGARRSDRITTVLAAASLIAWTNAVMLDGRADDPPTERAGGASGPGNGVAHIGDPETVFAAYGGVPFTHASDIRFEQAGSTDLTVHGVNWDGRPFKSPIYYGLRATRWSGSSPFGAMLDFTHSKTISQRAQQVRLTGNRNGRAAPETARIEDTFKHLEFSHGHNMLTVNGVMRLGALSPRVTPYIGGGAGVNLPHTEIQFTGDDARTYEYQYAGPVGQVLAGFEIRLPRISVFIEYKFTLARYEVPLSGRDSRGWGVADFPTQLMAWWRGEKPRYGYARTTLASHQIIAGAGPRVARTGLGGADLRGTGLGGAAPPSR